MYAVARMREAAIERSYREYVTESLRLIPQGKYLAQGWAEPVKQHTDFDAESVIDGIIERAGLEVVS